jgi:ATP-dependent DNA ligase
VVDGEIVIASGPGLDFEALLQRIHPAASRVDLLARETPAMLVTFDLLALGDESLMERPLAERRAALEEALAGAEAPVHRTLVTDSLRQAERWFRLFEGAGLDGVVAKPPDLPYLEDQRVMFKVKHERTADCVVAGFRWHKKGPVVGSLLLGLYDERGKLQHVGVSASFSMERRRELLDELAPYDHMEGRRFRHTAQFRRWRYDRDPESCTYEQLERPVEFDLADVLAGRAPG